MGEGSVQPSIPESGGSKTPSQESPKDESADSEHNNVTSSGSDKSGNAKPIKTVLIFAAFEAGGYVFSEIADGVGGWVAVCIHWISLCCAAAGVFAAWHEIVDGEKASRIWTVYGVLCMFLALIGYVVWHPDFKRQHLRIGFETSTSHAFWLTNDFLSDGFGTNDVSWQTSGKLKINSPWVILTNPTTNANIALNIVLDNDSDVDAEDISLTVVFLGDVNCSTEGDWLESKRSDDNTYFGYKESFLSKKRGIGLFPILFNSPSFPPHKGQKILPGFPVIIMLDSKNGSETKLQFWLAFVSESPSDHLRPEHVKSGVFGSDMLNVITNGENISIKFNYSNVQMGDTND